MKTATEERGIPRKDTTDQNPICVFTDSKFSTRQDFSPGPSQEGVKIYLWFLKDYPQRKEKDVKPLPACEISLV